MHWLSVSADQEIQHICKCAVQRNSYQMSVSARRQSFEAWRQLVEMLLTGCPADLLTGELRQNVIFELLQDLLDKACLNVLLLKCVNFLMSVRNPVSSIKVLFGNISVKLFFTVDYNVIIWLLTYLAPLLLAAGWTLSSLLFGAQPGAEAADRAQCAAPD